MLDRKKIVFLIVASLFILAAGLFTSISLMAGFHLFIISPILLCALNYDWKKFPKSGWALLAFVVILIASVIANQGMIARPMKNILKAKYYLLGAMSIIPLQFYFQDYLDSEKRRKVLRALLYTVLISSSLATLSGLLGYFTGFNPIRMVHVNPDRNSGLFGMLITYSHSIAWLSVLLVGMCFQYENFKTLISRKWLIVFTLFSIVGLFTTYTRGAWISFLAGCSLINKKLTLVMVALCALGILGMSLYSAEFWNEQILRRSSNQERWGSVLAATKAFQEKPLLGYGYLNFEPYSKAIKAKYHLPEPDFGGHAHSDFFEILATSGLLGGICFLMWIGLWIREMQKRGGLAKQTVLPFILAFLVSGLTHVSLNDGENAFFLMILYALSEVL